MAVVSCTACGTENEAGRKFCGECGTPLTLTCPACSTPNTAGAKFCGECGAALAAGAAPSPAPAVTGPVAERRLVSVLFADLVGFTAASESRDAEESRELLTRYFDVARTIIERYGGTVEKFIGDAVMAVWGTPTANEDDAERAVRAALELIDAIPGLDRSLQARGGVLTGEAAVTLGATDQGMVAGDIVNACSRIQSEATPGSVLVGDATRRATEAAIAYADAGERDLKGKAEPMRLWHALRVVANRAGSGRSVGLEAPFVGRERELRLLKDVFHATADDGRAHLLSTVGVAGIGKSRLAWEFEKYVDGLAGTVWWHRGRCLSYGEGVAYWALAEMIRMRARIAEDEARESALAKLATVIEEFVADPGEREFVEPRLQHLLGLTDRVAPDRQDLFSGWRLFIERMADRNPVIMVLEDIQWADAGLIEFVEYLLDWSRASPLFVLALARPEVSERHPSWGAGIRSFTSLVLDPLPDDAIDSLLRGLVPGLPAEAVERIRERADGVPLYAVETVRTLLDRGLLEPADDGYRVLEDLTALDVPETLHALIASRLDGLTDAERRCLQNAAVLGKTFSPRGLAALSQDPETDALLASLVRKELLFLQSDPSSPERGQYGFLQALVQRVAYDTLSRHDRKAKHLAAARYLAEDAGIDPDEIAEVIAAHFLDAARADVDAADHAEIRASARTWLERAGERATALAAADEAQRSFVAAAELADEPPVRARLLERAGTIARAATRLSEAASLLAEARDLYAEIGDTHAAARATAGMARVLHTGGQIEEAIRVGEEAYAVLAGDEPDEDTAMLAAELARLHFFAGDRSRGRERVEEALAIAERDRLPTVLSSALNTKALLLQPHYHEASALIHYALTIALEHNLTYDALRAYNNLAVINESLDRADNEEPMMKEALELARRHGDREWATRFTFALISEYKDSGRWDQALELLRTFDHPLPLENAVSATDILELLWERGLDEELAACLELTKVLTFDEANIQDRALAIDTERMLATMDGRTADAVEAAVAIIHASAGTGRERDWLVAEALRTVTDSCLAVDDAPAPVLEAIAVSRSLLGVYPPRIVVCQVARLEGMVAALQGDPDAAVDRFGVALAAARSRRLVLWTAEILRDYAFALLRDDRPDDAEPLLAEAREIAARLGAHRTLERLAVVERLVPSASAAQA